MKSKNILQRILHLFEAVKTDLSIEQLEDGKSIEIADDKTVYLLLEDGSRGELAPDGEHKLVSGEVITIKDGKLIEIPVENPMKAEDAEEVKPEDIKQELPLEIPVTEEVISEDPMEGMDILVSKIEELLQKVSLLEERISQLEFNGTEVKQSLVKLSKQPKETKEVILTSDQVSRKEKAKRFLNS